MKGKRLAVIGLGKLGLCTAACFARAGYDVVGMDASCEHVEQLNLGNVTFFEEGLADLLREVGGRLRFTTDTSDAIDNSDACFIIVPTPSQAGGAFSNKHVARVIKSIGPELKASDDWYVVDVVSTVMPGSGDQKIIPLLEEVTGKRVGVDLGYAYNPEFIAIGTVIRNFINPDVVLIGQSDERTGSELEAIYRATCDNTPHIARTSVLNAEIAKLSINCYCTMKISFANNLANICENVPGADASAIAEILGCDSRIGPKYIKPGLGFGGPCFPRDNEAFIHFVTEVDAYAGLQQAVVDINKSQPDRICRLIAGTAAECGSRVALLGQAYKPFTYLTEESQAVEIAKRLARKHPDLELLVHDPLANESGPWERAKTLEECVRGANVAAILTPWPRFMETDWHGLLAKGGEVLNLWE